MALELTVRYGTVPSPELKPRFQIQSSESSLSSTDTPKKNKRKLNEPKRRTTDFSIKRLCPDSPGSACSESGRSEESTPENGRSDESTPERVHNDSRDSGEIDSPPGLLGDMFNPHLRPPFVFNELGQHPYLIPQFYCSRYPSGISCDRSSLPKPLLQRSLHSENNSVYSAPLNVSSITVRPNANSSQDTLSKPIAASSTVTSQAYLKQTHSRRTLCQAHMAPKPSQNNDDEDDDDDDESSPESTIDGTKDRKTYKSMTRERRVEANARERSRVHTISAAFDGLRHAVPSYSYNQKLSKLAILRIACSYINALTKLADADNDVTQLKDMSFGQCVDKCTRTIQTEGKARRRH